jgi:hypothetical protein
MYLRLATGDLREVALAVPGARAPERMGSDERILGVYSGVFVSLGTRLHSACGPEAGFGAAFRSFNPHAAIPGSVPLRSKCKVLRPECCSVSLATKQFYTKLIFYNTLVLSNLLEDSTMKILRVLSLQTTALR